jgi:cytochrome c-type biogenesis protein
MPGWEFLGGVVAAFAAGMLSFLSPCVMPLMPAYLSLISGLSVEEIQDAGPDPALRRRIVRACLGFVAGFSTVFIVLGASATAIGRVLRTADVTVFGVELGIAQLAGLVIVLMGLHIAGLLPIHLLYRDAHVQVEGRQRSVAGAYLVGAAFAFGWSPCVGPILSGILAIAASRDTVLQGVGLLAVYSAGLAVPFLITGYSLEYFFRAFGRVKRYFRALEVASGTLLVVIGVLVLTDQLTRLNGYFVFLNRVVSTLEKALL